MARQFPPEQINKLRRRVAEAVTGKGLHEIPRITNQVVGRRVFDHIMENWIEFRGRPRRHVVELKKVYLETQHELDALVEEERKTNPYMNDTEKEAIADRKKQTAAGIKLSLALVKLEKQMQTAQLPWARLVSAEDEIMRVVRLVSEGIRLKPQE